MLKHQLIHPKINEILGRAGHHGKILIADGNYPASSTLGPNAELVSLNLSPGIVSCSQVLAALVSAIPIEAAYTMQPETTGPYAHDQRSAGLGAVSRDPAESRPERAVGADREMGYSTSTSIRPTTC